MNSTSTHNTDGDWHGRRDVDVHLHVPARTILSLLLGAAFFLIAIAAVHKLEKLLLQLVVAVFLAVAADSVVHRLERRGFKRGQGIMTVMLGLAIAVAAAAAIFVPPVVEQGQKLVDRGPGLVQDVRGSRLYENLDDRFHVGKSVTTQFKSVITTIPKRVGSIAGVVVDSIFSIVTLLILVTFLLVGGPELAQSTVRVFPKLGERTWWTVIQGAYLNIGSYVVGALTIAGIAGITMTIMLLVLGIPFALPLGLWMLLLDLIPLIGASIGAIPAVAVAFVAGGTLDGFIMLGFVIAYQQIENIIIQPKIQGRGAQLSAVVIFLAVLIGSTLLGIVGALLAVPIASIVAIVVRQYMVMSGDQHAELPSLHESTSSTDSTA